MKYNLITVVWGEEHTDMFINVCIPSLLTAGNINVLCTTPNPVFRIFTTPKDANRIKNALVSNRISKALDIKIDMISEDDFSQKYTLVTKYFRKAIDLAVEDNAAAIIIGPESMLSEGYISNLLRIAESGKKVVMISQLRVNKDKFLPQLLKEFSANGTLGEIKPRQLVRLALEHLHPFLKSSFWSSNNFNNAPSHIYFEVPGEGLLARCFHLSPALINSVYKNAGFTTSLDGDYIQNACPDMKDIYIVSDSDELMSVELTGLSYLPNVSKRPPNALNIAAFAKYFTCSHNRIFIKHKIRFHYRDISSQWESVERLSDQSIDKIFNWLRFEPLLIWPYGISLKLKSYLKNIVKFFLGEAATKKLSVRMRLIQERIASLTKGFLQRIEFNRAVFFGIMGKTCSVITGPITALLIATNFTPHLQGCYYTFLNLLALQAFVELGLGTVIIQFASHEWSRLGLDKNGYIKGEIDALSRLSSLGRFTFKWYIVSGVIVAIGLGIGGYLFFVNSAPGDIVWVWPWFFLSMLTGLNLCFIPIWSLLEGCNQVTSLYKYRFLQGLFSSLVVWLSILSGAGLWALSISAFVVFVYACLFLWFKYRNFLKSILGLDTINKRILWRKEILPMQWRLALSSISGYFAFSLFTPIIFKYAGAVAAGQMGMSLSLAGFITALPGAWLTPKVPQFGMLIASRDYLKLDKVFFRINKIYMALLIGSALFLWSFVYILNIIKNPIASRLIAPIPMAILLLAQAIVMISLPFSFYLRAHKREPLFIPSIMLGIFIGVSTVILGRLYSVNGVVAGYLVSVFLVVPSVFIIWHKCRKKWHRDDKWLAL